MPFLTDYEEHLTKKQLLRFYFKHFLFSFLILLFVGAHSRSWYEAIGWAVLIVTFMEIPYEETGFFRISMKVIGAVSGVMIVFFLRCLYS